MYVVEVVPFLFRLPSNIMHAGSVQQYWPTKCSFHLKHTPQISLSRWVNRKDPRGKNLFAGGFLGLDNIGKSVYVDRSLMIKCLLFRSV